MAHVNTITEVRESHGKVCKESNGRVAVIVSTQYTKRAAYYGVQFWTPEMIEIGTSENTDRTVSTFIEKL